MRILTLQKNRNLILAGILAFAVLFFTQVSVQAYEFVGGLRSVLTIGGSGILTIGNPAYDSSLNIGNGPSITTNAPTLSYNQASYADLKGALSDMGELQSVNGYFDWGYTPAYGTTIPMGAIIGATSETTQIQPDSGRVVYYQFRASDGTVTMTGGQQIFTSMTQANNYAGLAPMAGIVPILLIIGLLSGSGWLMYKGIKEQNTLLFAIGFICLAAAFITFGITLDSITAIITR